jgi:hypothetical protein
MASRRKLKKTIQFVTTELITEIYFRYLINNKVDAQKIEKMVLGLITLSREFQLRSNHIDGKSSPHLVKAYYRRLYGDWQLAVEKMIMEIQTL